MSLSSGNSPITGRDVVSVFVVAAALLLVELVGLRAVEDFLLPEDAWIPERFVIAAMEVAFIAAPYLVLIRTRRTTWRQLGWTHASPTWLALAVPATVGMLVAEYGVSILAYTLFGLRVEDTSIEVPAQGPGFAVLLLVGAVMAPFAEETLFRGILYRWMRDRFGVRIGVVGSSLLFGVLHGPSAPLIFVVGLMLAYLYERSGSLQVPMLVHAFNNTVVFAAGYLTLGSG